MVSGLFATELGKRVLTRYCSGDLKLGKALFMYVYISDTPLYSIIQIFIYYVNDFRLMFTEKHFSVPRT